MSGDKAQETQLYRHYNKDGVLLYVGISFSAIVRQVHHKKFSHWYSEVCRIDIETFPYRREALVAEKNAIAKEKPLHNIHHNVLAIEKSPKDYMAEKSRELLAARILDIDPVYTIEEVARIFEVQPVSVRKLIENGDLGSITLHVPHTRNPYRIIVRVSGFQLLEFMERLAMVDTVKRKKVRA